MRRRIYKKSQTIRSSPFYKMINGAIIILSVLSFLLHPNILAAAGTNSEDGRDKPNQFFLPLTQRGGGANYVSPVGNDSNPGTYRLPWRTIGKATSMVAPGDTVYLRGGIYNEQVYVTTSGTASLPIKILAYPGENPVIDGSNTIPEIGGSLLRIIGDYIYASGIEIRNSAYEGIRIQGNYVVVSNMFIHHSQSNGITIIQGHNSTAQYNLVWRNSLMNEFRAYRPWGAGISAIREGVSYATIRHNTVWENWGEGISSSSADHTTIEDNIIHDNFSANLYVTSSTNVLVQRNFVYTNPTSYVFPYSEHGGIMMGDETYDPPSANIIIINNISYGNQGNFWWWQGDLGGGMNNVLIANNSFINGIGNVSDGRGGVIISEGDHQNVRFENNIVQQDGDLPAIMTMAQPGVTYSNNLWTKPPLAAASGPGDIIGDPLFAKSGDSYSPEWFKLTAISPAINGALYLAEVYLDYFGSVRESVHDMGANEFFLFP